jgi:hypothetical protein
LYQIFRKLENPKIQAAVTLQEMADINLTFDADEMMAKYAVYHCTKKTSGGQTKQGSSAGRQVERKVS